MEGVQKVRELEQLIIADAKNANFLLVVKKQLDNEEISKEERTAALHSLRRIFIHFLESGRLEASFVSAHSNQLAFVADGDKSKKLQDYKKWLIKQFNSYQDTLRKLISSNDTSLQAPAIRTLLEFVRREYMVSRAHTEKSVTGTEKDAHSWFGVRTCQTMLESLLSLDDIDIDILLLLRDEMFTKPDCSFYSLGIIVNLLKESKASLSSLSASASTIAASALLVKNSLDMLRFITLPEDDEQLASRKLFLVKGKGSAYDGNDDEDSSGDEEEDNDGNEVARVKSTKKGGGMKRQIVPLESSSKKQKRLSRSEQLVHLPSHRKIFSKAWLALLAMPLSNAQHKIVLKHLPENVINNLSHPLLLADYMTQSYEQGGVVAVLALESLFQLIVRYNLDYPKFFASLYRLCNYDVLSAKYRSKFMKLLTMCLRSANMPAYLVAAFAKRLAQLSLRVPSPSALFCVAQVTWLLRQHPQCMVLVHKHSLVGVEGAEGRERREFDALEEHDIEKCDALHSSLWEMETLSSHCFHTVSTFAKALQGTPSTSNDMDAPSLIVEDFIEHTYASLMETEAGGGKVKKEKDQKNAALAYKEPTQLLPVGDVIRSCFGSL